MGYRTNGAEAAICLATIACIAGTDVEKCQALPYVKKRKDQVIIPKYSRNPYELGVPHESVSRSSKSTPPRSCAPNLRRTAMVYILSGPDTTAPGPMSIASLCATAKEKSVPVFVDAAAEEPMRPNIHLAAGATLVGYWRQVHARAAVLRHVDRE